MSKLVQNISISQNLPSTRTTLISTCFILILSIIYILNHPSNSNNTLLSTTSNLTLFHFFSSSSNSLNNNNNNNNNHNNNNNNTRVCDIFDGRWVYDESNNPNYAPRSCSYVQREFNCFGNGRSDLGYLKYRWQPYGCDIPRLDANKMMEILRGKRLVFVGDSLNRNMCQSLVCSLKKFNGKSSISGDFYSYNFKDYNCSIKFVTAPFLVQQHKLKNKKETLRLDTMEASISKYRYADILIFNTGHWWNHNKSKNGLSRYTHNPSDDHHWIALRRLLRYLKGTMNWGLHYSKFPGVLEGFCYANWVSGNDEINSTCGYVFTLGGGAVSWKSCKQSCTAISTMESKFIALEVTGYEAEWLGNVLADVPLWGKPAPSVALHCDLQAAIVVATNLAYNGKKRHIRLRHKAVKDLLYVGVISLDYVMSEKNIADPLTIGLC